VRGKVISLMISSRKRSQEGHQSALKRHARETVGFGDKKGGLERGERMEKGGSLCIGNSIIMGHIPRGDKLICCKKVEEPRRKEGLKLLDTPSRKSHEKIVSGGAEEEKGGSTENWRTQGRNRAGTRGSLKSLIIPRTYGELNGTREKINTRTKGCKRRVK